jgi:preprotein translocase subunit SecG
MVYLIITILILIASILLVGVVLIQKSKGGGLSENFGKGNDMFGVQKTTDIVEKLTWGLVAFIVVLSVVSVAFTPSATQGPATQKSEVTAPTSLPTNPNVEGNGQGQGNGQAAPAAPAAPAQ